MGIRISCRFDGELSIGCTGDVEKLCLLHALSDDFNCGKRLWRDTFLIYRNQLDDIETFLSDARSMADGRLVVKLVSIDQKCIAPEFGLLHNFRSSGSCPKLFKLIVRAVKHNKTPF